MSTRCQVVFYESEGTFSGFDTPVAKIYRHSDGYPEGVWDDLIAFVKEFIRKRGFYDPEYMAARFLQAQCNAVDGVTAKLLKVEFEKDGWDSLIQVGVLGYGTSVYWHCDIEYLYCVYPDRVECRKVNMDKWWHSEGPKKKSYTRVIKREALNG